MDSARTKMILQSPESIQVLHNGTPVWIENVMDNNTAEITYLDKSDRKDTVPVYLLVENRPAKQ